MPFSVVHDLLLLIAKTYQVPISRLLKFNNKSELMFYPVGFLVSLFNGCYQPLCAWTLCDAMSDFYHQKCTAVLATSAEDVTTAPGI